MRSEQDPASASGVTLSHVTAEGDIHIRDVSVVQQILETFIDRQYQAQYMRNRSMLLNKVSVFWINGVLQKSTQGLELLQVDLEEQPDSTAFPWETVVFNPYTAKTKLESTTSIEQVFDNTNQSMLLLGEPGSGKTVWLLRLAKALIERATKNPLHPIPVILNFASWSSEQKSLKPWILKEMRLKYGIPTKVCQPWIEDDELILLLDGLDEVQDDLLNDCVHAINSFLDEHLPSIAVSCRSQEYEMLSQKLYLHGALKILPLSPYQIEQYAIEAGFNEQNLQILLANQEFVKTPLGLSLAINVLEESPSPGPEEFDSDIMPLYVEKMLTQKGVNKNFPDGQTLDRLSWIARQMSLHNRSEFWLEQLQPSWLETRFHKVGYDFLVLLIFSLLMVISCLVSGLFASFMGSGGTITNGLRAGISISSMILAACWLVCILSLWFSRTLSLLLTCILFITGLLVFPSNLINAPAGAIIAGPLFALPGGVAGSMLASREEIKIRERMQWSWPQGLMGLVLGSLAGLFIGIISRFIGGQTEWRHIFLYSGAAAYLIGVAATYLLGFRSYAFVDKDSTPNSGIFASAYHCVRVFLLLEMAVLCGGLVIGALSDTNFPTGMLKMGGLFLLVGTPLAVIATLHSGGTAMIQHFTLRILVCRLYGMPFNLAEFLDFATERILLHRIGGGYMFTHSALLEYFAYRDLPVSSTKSFQI